MFFNTTNVPRYFPSQKKSTKEKTEEWCKQCVLAGEQILLYSDPTIRQTRLNKKTNYNLYNDILDVGDLETVLNPMGLDRNSFPATLRNYPIANPKINRLSGEELTRPFDFRVMVLNEDAISQKEQEKKEIIMQSLQNILLADMPEMQDPKQQEAYIQEKLKETEKYLNFEWQEQRELGGTWILQHYYLELDLKTAFNRGFHDALIAGEEIYCIDEVSGEPVVRRCNPLNTYALMEPDTLYWDEADMILEEGYRSIGYVIDLYHDYLTPDNIEFLEKGYKYQYSQYGTPKFSTDEYLQAIGETRNMIDIADTRPGFGGMFDTDGNVRVIRLVWKSRRKIGKLKYYDEQGEPQETWVDELYKADKSLGEEIEWLWINEYWEGTKIANDIFVKMQPRPIQFRRMSNPSRCKSGYVGTQYMTGVGKAMSLMDRIKPYQYLYNIYMYRLELLFAKNKGVIGELDLAKVPDGWEIDKWMHYAEVHGWAIVDSFKEAKKGAATGKLAGNFNTTGRVLNMEVGQSIQQHINMLDFIKNEIGEITGISRQREGDIAQSAGLGTTQQAIMNSAQITEPWFYLHERTKLRVMDTLLDTAKYCISTGKAKKMQHILDDMTIVTYQLEPDQFCEAEYGIMTTNSANDRQLYEALKQLAHAGIQNDKINFSQLMDIYTTTSLSSIRRKIERAESDKQKLAQQNAEADRQTQMEMQKMQSAENEAEREMTRYKIDSDNETRIRVAEMQVYSRQQELDQNNNGIPDPMEIAGQAMEERKQASGELSSNLDRILKDKEIQNKTNIEKEKIATQKEIAKMKADAEKYKADNALKIAKENRNKYDKK